MDVSAGDRSTSLARTVWPDVQADRTVVVPLGSLEQHGPHLPLDTDTRIARALCGRLRGVSVAPALEYGASGEHEGFPGTVSLGSEALYSVLLEYGRSAHRWATRVVFVNGHGGNGPALADAVIRLRYEGRDSAWFPCSFAGSDAHAGRTETSVLLHLSPEDVRMERAEAGNVAPIEALLPTLRTGGMSAVTANGVLGDPLGASAEEGATLIDDLALRADAAVTRWEPNSSGMLT